jgi:hypothetical protein
MRPVASAFADLSRLLQESEGVSLAEMRVRFVNAHGSKDVEAAFEATQEQLVVPQDDATGLWFWDRGAA